MKIKVSHTTEREIEFEFPRFWKRESAGDMELVGAINDQTIITITQGERVASYFNGSSNSQRFAIIGCIDNKWTEITEEQFMKEYSQFLRNQSLQAELSLKDDLTHVNI